MKKNSVLFFAICVWSLIFCFKPIQFTNAEDEVSQQEARDLLGFDGQENNDPDQSKLSHEELIEALIARLDAEDQVTRIKAGMVLKQSVKLSDVPLLVQTLKKGNNVDKQLSLIEAMGLLGDRRVGDALRFEIERGLAHPEARRAAITALGNLRFDWPVPLIVEQMISKKDLDAARRAASALGVIRSTDAVYGLENSLIKIDSRVLETAKWAIALAKGEIDNSRIDTKFPAGRKLTLYYKGTRYYFYQPSQRERSMDLEFEVKPRLLICVHNSPREIAKLFEFCWNQAKEQQFATLVPVFDNSRFPEYGTLNIGGERADKRLLEIIQHLVRYAKIEGREVYLFGEGEGGDFAERFVMAYPERTARAVIFADNFTYLNGERVYPESIKINPLAPDIKIDVEKFLKTEIAYYPAEDMADKKNLKKFETELTSFSQKAGLRSRVSFRKISQEFRDPWIEAIKFIFN